MFRRIISAGLLCFMLGFTSVNYGCESKKKHQGAGERTGAQGSAEPFAVGSSVFTGNNSLRHLESTLSKASIEKASADLIWSLSNCDCAPEKMGEYLAKRSEISGALPQPLVPSIRKEILADSNLKFLLKIKNNFSNIGSALERMFANDDKISASVRSGLADKISASLPGGKTNLLDRIPFRFDLFPPVAGSIRTEQAIKAVTISDQAILWATPFARPELWSNSRFLAFGDHGLQLLYVAKTLASWQYAFGLRSDDPNSQADVGGLAFDPNNGDSAKIGPYDPRVNKKARPHVISGTYTIEFPENGVVDLATNITPKWSRKSENIDLSEQATLAIGAALAFSRLRPENRQSVSAAFGSQKLFPENAHELPLIFLSALGELLSEKLINSDKQEIYQFVPSQGESPKLADIKGTTRLLRALNLWVSQTDKLKGAELPKETRLQLEEGNGELFRATQLVAQSVLARFVRHGKFTTDKASYSLVIDEQGTPPTFSEAAELIATLTSKEGQILSSPLLQERVIELVNWFAATYLSSESDQKITADGILWSLVILKNTSALKLEPSANVADDQLSWVKALHRQLESIIERWS